MNYCTIEVMMKYKVVIIGNSYTTRLGLIWSIVPLGCDITVIAVGHYNKIAPNKNPSRPIDCYSKYVQSVLYFNEEDGKKQLIELILAKCVDYHRKTILIPSSDFSASAIDENLSLLDAHFLYPHIKYTEGAVSAWMNKMMQKDKAIENGLNVPEAVVLKSTNHQYDIPEGIKYPCFTKPMTSLNGGKKCVGKCCNRKELERILKTTDQNGISNILVEEYIEIENEYAVLGFSDGKDVIIPGMIQFLKGSNTFPGIALMGKVFSIHGYEELITKFKSYIQDIGFVGLFDIDFFEADGKFYFGELNLRIGGSGYAITKMGVNLPAMFVKFICGEDIRGMKCIFDGSAVYVNERISIIDWYKCKLSTKEYKDISHSADISFINSADDVAPQKIFHKIYIQWYWKRIFKLLIHYRK